jgi:hypothetical protein
MLLTMLGARRRPFFLALPQQTKNTTMHPGVSGLPAKRFSLVKQAFLAGIYTCKHWS